jgi:cytochrome c5
MKKYQIFSDRRMNFTFVMRSLTEKKHLSFFHLSTFVQQRNSMKTVLFLGSMALVAMITSCRTTEEVSKVEPSNGPINQPVEEPVKDAALSANAMAGQGLFNQHCGKCHDLPVVQEYSAERWDRIVPSMAKKSHLTAEEEASVMAFVKESLK